MALNVTNIEIACLERPEHLTGDIVRISYLTVLVMASAVVNLVAFEHLDKNRPPTSAQMPLFNLKKHVNISSLCVTIVFGLSDIVWFITYEWRAGDFMCKLVNAARIFSFYASANIIVVVALYRVLMIAKPCLDKNASYKRVRKMLICAWTLAIIFSIPQFFVWIKTEATLCDNTIFSQCSDIFSMTKDDQLLQVIGTIYNASSLFILFWLPFGIITTSYICLYLYVNTSADAPKRPSRHIEFSLVDLVHYTERADDEEKLVQDPIIKEPQPNMTAHDTQQTILSAQSNVNGKRATLPHFCLRPETALSPLEKQLIENASISVTKEARCTYKSICDHLKTNWKDSTLYRWCSKQNAVKSEKGEAAKRMSKARKLTTRIAWRLTVAFVICYLPYNVCQIIKMTFGRNWYEDNMQEWDALNALLIFNAFINPFLYGVFETADCNMILGTSYRL